MNLPRAVPADRRAHDRFPVRVAAQLVLPDRVSIGARTLDLGRGGAGVVCDLNVPVSTQLELRMNLAARPGGSALFEATATVVNCTLTAGDGGFRLGLQFQSLSDSASAALKGVLPG